MKARLRFYFETSVWRRLVDPTDPRRTHTYRLTTLARRRHTILASRIVVAELRDIPDGELRRHAKQRFRRIGPTIVPTQARVTQIADELLLRGGWGERDLADMLHIGYSVVGGADVLVTWDKADLAREKTRRVVASLGRQWGFRVPDIATPREVLEEWLDTKIP